MSYRDQIISAMKAIAAHPRSCFIGYNVINGRAGGSLSDIEESKLIEMPLAENLMIGAAIGLALDGRIPVVWVERCDFLTCGMDALVNHLAHLSKLSEGMHNPGVIVRVCVGNKEQPLFTGPTHTQNFAEALKSMLPFNVIELKYSETIATHYEYALRSAERGIPSLLIEFKDLYHIE